MIVAFDVDNTLLREEQGKVVLNHDVVALMVAIKRLGLADIVVWSGGGSDYAAMTVRKFGISDLVWQYWAKNDGRKPDITVDDQECTLGTVNLKLLGDVVPTPWMGI